MVEISSVESNDTSDLNNRQFSLNKISNLKIILLQRLKKEN